MAFTVKFYSYTDEQEVIALQSAFLKDSFVLKSNSSGSTGEPKEFSFSKKQVIASANRSNAFFQLTSNSQVLCPLSFSTIGAKMALIRAIVGDYSISYINPNKLENLSKTIQFDLCSLVPTQLAKLTNDHYPLTNFKRILLGGNFLTVLMEHQITEIHSNVYHGYGMTETLSHIAIRKIPAKKYHLLDGVLITSNENGCEIVDNQTEVKVNSTDLLEIDNEGFTIIGRTDFAINSGGIKFFPEQLERRISEFISVPFCISSIQDDILGQKIVLLIEKKMTKIQFKELQDFMRKELHPYGYPKEQIQMSIPVANGKILRKDLVERMRSFK